MFVTSLLEGAVPIQVQRRLNAEALYLAMLLDKIDDPVLRAEQAYLDMKSFSDDGMLRWISFMTHHHAGWNTLKLPRSCVTL